RAQGPTTPGNTRSKRCLVLPTHPLDQANSPLRLDRHHAPARDDMHRAPEPGLAVMRGLQAEQPPVPVGVVNEADVLELEFELLPLPFRRPGEMRLVELLPQLRKLDHIGLRE